MSVVSCSKDSFSQKDEAEKTKGFSVTEAKEIFETACENMPVKITKSNSGEQALNLGLGTIVPDWESGEYSIDDQSVLESIDAKISTDLCFRVYQVDEDSQDVRVVKCYHKLVVARSTETQQTGCYIVFFIPSNEYSRSHHYDVSEEFLNSGSLGSYSGLKIWTNLNGDVVKVCKYDNGEKISGVSMLEKCDFPTFIAKVNAIRTLCAGLTFQRGEKLTKNQGSQSGGEVSGDWSFWESIFPVNWGTSEFVDGVLYVDTDGDDIPDYPIYLEDIANGQYETLNAAVAIAYRNHESSSDDGVDPDYSDENLGNSDRGSETNYYGGGSDSSGSDDGSSQPTGAYIDPKTLDYIGYLGEKQDCFAVATDLLRQTGVKSGTHHNLWLENGNTTNYLVKKYDCAESENNCVSTSSFTSYAVDQLRNGRLVMVGVDYMPNKGINKNTGYCVDHFVVLNGFFYSGNDICFYYIDTGRGPENYQYAYGDAFVFYYDADNDKYCAVRYHYYENNNPEGEYTIVQYRINEDI